MTLRAQMIVAIILLIFLAVILNMIKKRSLELKYMLGWILCDLALLVLDFVPNLIDRLSELLGIYSPVNMIFFLGFIFSLVIIFILTVALSRVTQRVRKLAQKMALETETEEWSKS
jgi:hypothetical protein